jgi:hypothetical protein
MKLIAKDSLGIEFEIDLNQMRIWIDALLSNNYTQTTGSLEDNDGFCCLGVGCKVLIPADKIKYREGMLRSKLIAGGDPMYQPEAPNWFKLINDDFELRHGIGLIALNDIEEYRYTFKQIAELLIKYYFPNGY